MKYVLSFSIVPGKGKQFWQFMNEKGIPFWKKFHEVRSAQVYTSLGGADLYEAYFDLPDYATFDKISRDPEFEDVSVHFMSLVDNVHRKFLTEERQIV
jgi:hypothetical protein